MEEGNANADQIASKTVTLISRLDTKRGKNHSRRRIVQTRTGRIERERSVRLDFGFEPASGGVVVYDEHVVCLRAVERAGGVNIRG
jgi:hypothetical protein